MTSPSNNFRQIILYILNTNTRLRNNCIQVLEDLHNEIQEQIRDCYSDYNDCRPTFEYVYTLLVRRQLFVDLVRDTLIELRDNIRFDDPNG